MIDHIDTIRTQSARVSELAGSGPLDAPVDSCPGWTLRDLVEHLGGVQRFWAEAVHEGRPEGPWVGETPGPPSDEGLGAWFDAGTELLIGALGDAGPDAACWTWWGEPRTAGAVARHQVQEAAVHRWDAESSCGPPPPIDTEVAVDGVPEFLEVMFATRPPALTGTIAFAASDTGDTWRLGGDGSPDLTVDATASDLLLVLYRRRQPTVVDLLGEAGLLHELFTMYDCE